MKKIIHLSLISFLLGSATYCSLQASSKEVQFKELTKERPHPIPRKIMKNCSNLPTWKRKKAIQSALDKEKAKIKRSAPAEQAQHLLLQPTESPSSAASAAILSNHIGSTPENRQPPTPIGNNAAGAGLNHAAATANVPGRKLKPSTEPIGAGGRPFFYGTFDPNKPPLVPSNRRPSIDERLMSRYGQAAGAGTRAQTSDANLGVQKRLAPIPGPLTLTVSPGGSLSNPIVFVSSSRPGSLRSPLHLMNSRNPSPSARSNASSPAPSGAPFSSTALVSYAPTPDQHLWLTTKKEIDELYGSDFHVHQGLKDLVARLKDLATKLTQRHVKAIHKLEDRNSAGKAEPTAASGSAAAGAFPSGTVPAAAALASPSSSSRDKVLVIDLYPDERSSLITEAMTNLTNIRREIPHSLSQSSLVGSLDRLIVQLGAPKWYTDAQQPLLASLIEIFDAPLPTQVTQVRAATQIPTAVLSIIMRYLKSPITLPSAESFQQQIKPKLSRQADRSWKCEHPDENVITNPAGFEWVPHLFLRYSAFTSPLESEPLPPRPLFTLLYNPERSDCMWTPSNKPHRANFCLAQYGVVDGNYMPWDQHSLFATLRLKDLENRGEQRLKFKKIFMGYVSDRPTEP